MSIEQIEKDLNVHDIDRDKALVELIKMTIENTATLRVMFGNQMLLMEQILELREGFRDATFKAETKEEAKLYAKFLSNASK